MKYMYVAKVEVVNFNKDEFGRYLFLDLPLSKAYKEKIKKRGTQGYDFILHDVNGFLTYNNTLKEVDLFVRKIIKYNVQDNETVKQAAGCAGYTGRGDKEHLNLRKAAKMLMNK